MLLGGDFLRGGVNLPHDAAARLVPKLISQTAFSQLQETSRFLQTNQEVSNQKSQQLSLTQFLRRSQTKTTMLVALTDEDMKKEIEAEEEKRSKWTLSYLASWGDPEEADKLNRVKTRCKKVLKFAADAISEAIPICEEFMEQLRSFV